MADEWSILLVEDDEDDYLITREFLEEIPGRKLNLHWVDNYEEGIALIDAGGLDICLVDYRIGGHTGLEFLAGVKAKGTQIPMVLLTGVGQRDIDVAATEAGAADFLDKSELSSTTLDRTIRYAIANAASMKALAEKTGFLETTLENTGAGIAAFDASRKLTMSNHLFDFFIDRFDSNFIKNKADITLEKIAALLDLELSQTVSVVCPDGHIFELRLNTVPSGGAVVFVLDITEQKALEETMIQARNDAQAASRAKSAFLSNISHELRTPLHSIIGYSDLILSGTDALNPKDCAGQIHESGTHLLSLIEDVLSYSKLESGEYSCNRERIFEIDGLIKASIAKVASAASRRNVTIEFTIDPQIISLFGDQMGLRQILTNLLSNAIEFSYEGGSVEVTLYALENGSASLCVRDHGVGMDPEKVDRAFVPFVQLDDSLDRSHEGTGLGLPIVKSVARHHNANISIETMIGEGTAVFITLPPLSVDIHSPDREQVATP